MAHGIQRRLVTWRGYRRCTIHCGVPRVGLNPVTLGYHLGLSLGYLSCAAIERSNEIALLCSNGHERIPQWVPKGVLSGSSGTHAQPGLDALGVAQVTDLIANKCGPCSRAR